MPELPEMEAWRRALDEPVRAFPIQQAGPAHIATLKTFEPPLSALGGRRLAGAERRGKRLLFPTEEGELVLTRVAVGDHILLGGDNMDLALAHLAAGKLAQQNVRLENAQMLMLWHSARAAKASPSQR